MALTFFNTFTRRKEEFKPIIDGEVRMYTCGPTVYDFAHIGNFRAYIFEDLLRRYLIYRGFKVTQVMNLTDIDDKTIRGCNAKGISLNDYTAIYKKAFFEDLDALKIQSAEHYPEATAHIKEMVDMVKILLEKGIAYTMGSSIYYRITEFPNYGRLSGMNLAELKTGVRIDVEEYEKETAADFALWKGWDESDGKVFWETELGKGRPGWHIECSAMSMKYLGQTFDIHTGGVDNIFPHHENEIAQTESFTGKPFARYWMHNGMLQLGGEKMSKSLGNIISIKDFLAKRDADVMRMLVLNGSYRAPLMFNEETLDAAEKGLERLKSALRPASASADSSAEAVAALPAASAAVKSAYLAAMDDDFNSAGALGVLFDFVRVLNTARDSGASAAQLTPAQALLRELTGVFGLRLSEKQGQTGAEKFIELLLEVRAEARRQKQWALSDLIRDRLKELGVTVEDGKTSATWRYL